MTTFRRSFFAGLVLAATGANAQTTYCQQEIPEIGRAFVEANATNYFVGSTTGTSQQNGNNTFRVYNPTSCISQASPTYSDYNIIRVKNLRGSTYLMGSLISTKQPVVTLLATDLSVATSYPLGSAFPNYPVLNVTALAGGQFLLHFDDGNYTGVVVNENFEFVKNVTTPTTGFVKSEAGNFSFEASKMYRLTNDFELMWSIDLPGNANIGSQTTLYKNFVGVSTIGSNVYSVVAYEKLTQGNPTANTKGFEIRKHNPMDGSIITSRFLESNTKNYWNLINPINPAFIATDNKLILGGQSIGKTSNEKNLLYATYDENLTRLEVNDIISPQGNNSIFFNGIQAIDKDKFALHYFDTQEKGFLIEFYPMASVGLVDEQSRLTTVGPNPFTSQLTVSLSSTSATYMLINNLGQVVDQGELNSSNNTLTPLVNKGLYTLILNESNKVTSYKLVKN